MSEPISPERPRAVEGINALDLAIILAKRKTLVFGLPVFAAIVAAIVSFFLPSIYTATAQVFPPQPSQNAAGAILSQLGNLSGVGGGIGGLSKPQNDLYMGMLRSRTISDTLIERFDLKTVYEVTYQSQARDRLAKETGIASGKDGIILIAVDDKDPKRAAAIANAYVDELLKLTNVLAISEASLRRLFFERQFAQSKDNLAKAEANVRQALAKGGLVKVDDQGKAMVEITARLRAQLAVKEVNLGTIRSYAAEGNPELQKALKELESLKREIARLEGEGRPAGPASTTDSRGIDSLRLLRDMKYYETVYELLAKQFELAKIDEAKESPVVQVLDRAVEPDRRSKPSRRLIVMLSAFIALFVAIAIACTLEALTRARNDPDQGARMLTLKRYLSWRRGRTRD